MTDRSHQAKQLSGHVAVVTGASSGIGAAIARRFAQAGAAVMLVHHYHRDDAKQIVADIAAAGGKSAEYGADVGQEDEVEPLFAATRQSFGRPTLLVNAAGVNARGTLVADMTVKQFETVLRTDVIGPFLYARAFVREAQASGGGGKIINVTSVHEETPQPGAADYCAAKGALRNFTRCLALEVAGAGITVNNLAPGMVLTPMNQKAIDDPALREKMTSQIPLKRAAAPEEIAGLALFLASADADYATGASFVFDGGFQFSVAQGA